MTLTASEGSTTVRILINTDLSKAKRGFQLLNGKQLTANQPHRLRSGFRIILGVLSEPLEKLRSDQTPTGHSHVFRFNNPEEVRKIRDRVRSTLQTSISAADIESAESTPGPPLTAIPDDEGEDVEDADWVYAQREAALARLHGMDPGLESLPDEDLNKLFDRITKLKTQRGRDSIRRPDSAFGFRPESSLGFADSAMSLTDDVWSDVIGRPAYTDNTDDTSMETDSPGMEELEATKAEFEQRLSTLEESDQAEDLKIEKDHMEQQLKMVQNQMKRLMELRAKGATEEAFEMVEPTIYTARQLRLIRKVLDKWRAHRAFSMAEAVLSGAVLVKEANVLRYGCEMSSRR